MQVLRDRKPWTWIKQKNCSPEWKDHRKQIADRFFIPFFGKRDIRTIKTIHIEEFRSKLEERGLSDKYVYNIMGELRAFFRFHKESIPELPTFRKVEIQEPVIRCLDEESQDLILSFIPKPHLPIFLFMKYSGYRENEAMGLLKKNIFLDKKPPFCVLETVRDRKGNLRSTTKTKKLKIIPIIPEMEWIFDTSPNSPVDFVFSKNGRPYSGRMLRRIWDKANRESGVEPCNLYNSRRHSFATQRLNQGYSLDEIRAVMGHTDIRTTQR